MPQAGIGSVEVATLSSVFNLEKIDPKAKDEKKRIAIPNPQEASFVWRHAIGGQRAAGAFPPGTQVEWVGNYECFGRNEVLSNANPHLDPDACVMCRMHRDGDPMVDKAARKWVLQVFEYRTDPSAVALMQPFTVKLVVWVFSDKEYGQLNANARTPEWLQLVGIQQPSADPVADAYTLLRSVDFILTCTSAGFKTWDVAMQPPMAAWTTAADRQQQALAIYQAQAAPAAELERIIAKRASNDNEVLTALAEARNKMAGQAQMQGMYAPQQQAGWPATPGMPAPAPAAWPQVPGVPMPMAPAAALPELAAPPPLAGAPIPPPAMAPAMPALPPFAAPQTSPAAAQPAMAPPAMPAPAPAPAAPQVPPPAPAMAAPPQPGIPQMPAMPVPAAPVAPPAMAPPPMPVPPPAAAPAPPGVPQMPAQPAPPPAPAPPTQPPPAPGTAPVDLGAMLNVPPPPPPPPPA